MQDRSKPTNAVASVGRRSFRLDCHKAVRLSVVITAREKRNLSIDPICADVAALAMVGADVRETPATMLETLQSRGL